MQTNANFVPVFRRLNESIISVSGAEIRGKDQVAETFEAVLGAIYVDSQHSVATVKSIIRKLGLADHEFLMSQDEFAKEDGGGKEITRGMSVQEYGCYIGKNKAANRKRTRYRNTQLETANEGGKHSRGRSVLDQIMDRVELKPSSHTKQDETAKPEKVVVTRSAEQAEAKRKALPKDISASPDEFDDAKLMSLSPQEQNDVARLRQINTGSSVERAEIARKALREFRKLREQGRRPKPLKIYHKLRSELGKMKSMAMAADRRERRQAKEPSQLESESNKSSGSRLDIAAQAGAADAQGQTPATVRRLSFFGNDRLTPVTELKHEQMEKQSRSRAGIKSKPEASNRITTTNSAGEVENVQGVAGIEARILQSHEDAWSASGTGLSHDPSIDRSGNDQPTETGSGKLPPKTISGDKAQGYQEAVNGSTASTGVAQPAGEFFESEIDLGGFMAFEEPRISVPNASLEVADPGPDAQDKRGEGGESRPTASKTIDSAVQEEKAAGSSNGILTRVSGDDVATLERKASADFETYVCSIH